METQKYKFKNLHELYDRVPAERIEDCMKELTHLLIIAKSSDCAIRALISSQGKDISGPILALPEEFEWVDDNKGTVEARIKDVCNIKLQTK